MNNFVIKLHSKHVVEKLKIRISLLDTCIFYIEIRNVLAILT